MKYAKLTLGKRKKLWKKIIATAFQHSMEFAASKYKCTSVGVRCILLRSGKLAAYKLQRQKLLLKRNQLILRMYYKHKSILAVADILGCSYSNVYWRLKKVVPKPKKFFKRGRPVLNSKMYVEKHKKLLLYYKKHKPVAKVAKKFKLSKQRIWSIVHRAYGRTK